MNLNKDEITKIGEVIERSHKILIIPHRQPDGDTLGASLGMYHILNNLGKSVDLICLDPPAPVFSFMPGIELIKNDLNNLNYDSIFIMDAGATHLTGRNESHPELFDKSLEVINIDHHPSNDYYGKYNVVCTRAASTTAVLYQMFTLLGLNICKHTATCLLTGLYTDTGSFMHSNTDSQTLRIASRLLAKGANLRSISKDIFNTTKISTMRLWGRVMRNTYKNDEGIAMSVIQDKDFKETGSEYTEMTGAVDYVNSIPGSEYSVILTERDGKVKGSLRTLNDDVDVAEIASTFGGGGHTKAAGFTIPGKLEKEIRWKIVD